MTEHLKYGDNGHLLYGPNGHLVYECGGCTGDDPYCSDCPCDAGLAETYTVTISGFPAICYADGMNGTHTVTWIADCQWYALIDSSYGAGSHEVLLHYSGGAWYVSWNVAASGGASGVFHGSGGAACDPTAQSYANSSCHEPLFCWNMCSNIDSNGVVTVSN